MRGQTLNETSITPIMKQRITYVVTNPDEFTPDQLHVGEDQSGPYFALDNVYAAKEHRITLGLNELPEEVCTATTLKSTKRANSS